MPDCLPTVSVLMAKVRWHGKATSRRRGGQDSFLVGRCALAPPDDVAWSPPRPRTLARMTWLRHQDARWPSSWTATFGLAARVVGGERRAIADGGYASSGV